MTTDRQQFTAAFQRPDPPAGRSRWLPYIAAIATVTLLSVLAFGVLWLLGGAR
jgi:hypothetical protein